MSTLAELHASRRRLDFPDLRGLRLHTVMEVDRTRMATMPCRLYRSSPKPRHSKPFKELLQRPHKDPLCEHPLNLNLSLILTEQVHGYLEVLRRERVLAHFHGDELSSFLREERRRNHQLVVERSGNFVGVGGGRPELVSYPNIRHLPAFTASHPDFQREVRL